MDFDLKTLGLIGSILYSIGCEIINFNPKLKSNSVLELIMNILKGIINPGDV